MMYGQSFGKILALMSGKTKVLALGLAMLFAAHANAASIIYFDDFSGSSDNGLNTTAPDTRPGTQTWTSSSNWKADGSKPVSSSAAAYLPFTPATGQVYTLSADVNRTGSGQDWLAIGFSSTADTGSFINSTPSAWMLLRGSRGDGGIQTFLGPTATSRLDHTAPTGTVNLKVVLDTTTALWSAQWYADDALLRTTSYTTNPTISYVGFGAHIAGVGTVDNFTLSAVPEPASLSLLALGGLALLRRRR